MKIAVQMDDFSTINPLADSTYALMQEASNRGHSIQYYIPTDLSYNNGEITAWSKSITWNKDSPKDSPKISEEKTLLNLNSVSVILMRQDPPFDMSYITATHILEMLKSDILVVNNPSAVRNSPEKLIALQFPDLIAPTLVSRNLEDLKTFRSEYRDIIIKPLYGNGGIGVFRLKKDDDNFEALLEFFFENSREPIMAQQFLSSVKDGDKRIILSDGEAIGAINRLPPAGQIRSNMHIGGKAYKSDLTERERYICECLKPYLREHGLIFTGIDVIGDYLTEVNVTSPTGLQEIGRFDGSNPSGMIWDSIEGRL